MAREDGFFDDLARGLADGSLTRGKALRLMGAALVGGALGSVGIGEASADPPGCKRNGKNCTRDTQCCSGNCSSGSCQAKTTTTTTSTSTSTTSTTTSTTSTSTTPMCQPNGGTCSPDGTPCCSGNCSNGFCCASGHVGLSNGTCAKPCDTGGECNVGCLCLPDELDPAGLRYFCGSVINNATFCASHGHCPAGQYCSGTGGDSSDGRCIVAC
jgi:hypothetical protein